MAKTKADETIIELDSLTVNSTPTSPITEISEAADLGGGTPSDEKLVTQAAAKSYMDSFANDAQKIMSDDIVFTSLTSGNILRYDGADWINAVAATPLDDPPVDGVTDHAMTSNYGFDHNAADGYDASRTLNVHGVATGEGSIVATDKTQTLTLKTLTSPAINTGISGTAVLDDDTMATASDTTIATSESIKAYVDTEVGASDDLSDLNDTEISAPAGGHMLVWDGVNSWDNKLISGDISITAGGVVSTAAGVTKNVEVQTLTNKTIDGDNNTITNLAHGSEVDNIASGVHGAAGTIVGTSDAQDLTNKTITSPILAGTLTGGSTLVKDEDDMTSDSEYHLSTQQSIKKYVDDVSSTYGSLSNLNDVEFLGLSAAQVFVYDGVNSWDNKTISGDLSISTEGVATLTASQRANAEFFYLGTEFSLTATGPSIIPLPSSEIFFINGMGIITTVLDGDKTVTTQPTIEYIAGALSGYQEAGLSGKATTTDTGLTASTQYYFKLNIDGAGETEYDITTGAGTVTFADIIILLEAETTGAGWSIATDDFRCSSDTAGASSSIALSTAGLSGTSLFDTLTDFSAFDSAEAGDAGTVLQAAAVTTALDDIYKRETIIIETTALGEQGYTSPSYLKANITSAAVLGGTSTLYRAQVFFQGISIQI